MTNILRMHPYVLTFFVNAAVLIFEITGARLVAPYFGASTDIWSAIIATVIGGLSLGYYVGGVYADRGEVRRKLVAVLWLCGALVLLIGAFHAPFLALAASLGHQGFFAVSGYALGAIAILFFAPSFLLGIAYPLLVKEVLTDMRRSGHEVGMLSAIGALGSIVGSLGAGLVLLPLFGSRVVILCVGVLLFALALVSAQTRERTAVAILGGMLVAIAFWHGFAPGSTALADIDSPYSRIIVREEREGGALARTVRTDAFGVQCAMIFTPLGPIEDVLAASYLATMREALRAQFQSSDDPAILFLGGCNYSLPRAVRSDFPHAALTVVEIDPAMTEVAEQFFGFDRSRAGIEVVHEDGRVYLNQDGQPQDAIVLDAFGAGPYIPFHLATREMFERARANLRQDGIFVANVIGGLEAYNGKLTGAVYTTLRDVFAYVRVYQVDGGGDGGVQNLIFVASQEMPEPDLPDDVTTHVANLAEYLGSPVLTDDRAPIESLTRGAR